MLLSSKSPTNLQFLRRALAVARVCLFARPLSLQLVSDRPSARPSVCLSTCLGRSAGLTVRVGRCAVACSWQGARALIVASRGPPPRSVLAARLSEINRPGRVASADCGCCGCRAHCGFANSSLGFSSRRLRLLSMSTMMMMIGGIFLAASGEALRARALLSLLFHARSLASSLSLSLTN